MESSKKLLTRFTSAEYLETFVLTSGSFLSNILTQNFYLSAVVEHYLPHILCERIKKDRESEKRCDGAFSMKYAPTFRYEGNRMRVIYDDGQETQEVSELASCFRDDGSYVQYVPNEESLEFRADNYVVSQWS